MIIAILGQKTKPVTVDISGVTVDANGVDATAGIVFRDAQGSVKRSHVTGLAIDESKNGYQVPGGFRSNNYGIGVAMVTRNKPPKNKPKVQPTRTLTLDYTRIDHYNAVGLLVDGSTGNYVPTQATPLGRVGDRPPGGRHQHAGHRPQLVPALQQLHRRRPDVDDAGGAHCRRRHERQARERQQHLPRQHADRRHRRRR